MNRTWRLLRLEASGRERESSWLQATENDSSYLNKREFTLWEVPQGFTASIRRYRLEIGKN